MCWVSWKRICQSKDNGGLGIKNLELFNASLLCKWKWRCLSDREAPWYDFLRWRYGSLTANVLYGEGRPGLRRASIWWRDIWKLGCEEEGNWFRNNISCILGDGNNTNFWKEKWIGTAPLFELFPTLYNKSGQQDDMISSMGAWVSNKWEWNFDWTAELTVTESEAAHDLHLILEAVQPRPEESDWRKWFSHAAGFFTVKTAYIALLNRLEVQALEFNTAKALKNLWLNTDPSKVSIFGWRLLLDKLPTMEALYNTGRL
ncbi:hypothetical protein TSUD_92010 [Trifolium subterraneum]|uniref:Reverse transcriptase zinc-binding domain-containing protein n=1 Tax=Trifolium subterraneum TaxID=3900 RepID=A0A2Z6P2Z3_TRISU|nr:hypothetical protein TSUD_92010 [Trifolium subterraneum]